MKQFNNYSTPRERVNESLRSLLDQENPTMPVTPVYQNILRDDTQDIGNMPPAMIYAPESTFSDLYEETEALGRGTLFSDLYYPFEGACSAYGVNGGMTR